jgi:hypothetical protein
LLYGNVAGIFILTEKHQNSEYSTRKTRRPQSYSYHLIG